MNNCKSCKKVLEFKRAVICTVNGKATELHHYCTFFEAHTNKVSKRNPRIERL